jgi:hypothetical protein
VGPSELQVAVLGMPVTTETGGSLVLFFMFLAIAVASLIWLFQK